MGEAGLEIRAAAEGDVEEILRLEREVAGAPHWARRAYEEIVTQGDEAAIRRCLLCARRPGGGLAGFVVAAKMRIGDAPGELESIVVAEKERRRGVGRALLRESMRWVRSQGGFAMELEVRARNEGAIGLYESMGFAVVGRRVRYYIEPVEDAVLMRCVLE